MHVTARDGDRGRCVYCHDAMASGDDERCAGCGVGLHVECWRSTGACPTIGCGQPMPQACVEARVRFVPRRATDGDRLFLRALTVGVMLGCLVIPGAIALNAPPRWSGWRIMLVSALVVTPVALLGYSTVAWLKRQYDVRGSIFPESPLD